MSFLDNIAKNKKILMIGGALVGIGGLVIAWRSYEAQKDANTNAQNDTAAQEQQDELLQSLLEQPLGATSSADEGTSTASTDTGQSEFDTLLADILGGGTSTSSSSTTSSGTTSTTTTGTVGSTPVNSSGGTPPAGSPTPTGPYTGTSTGGAVPVSNPVPVRVSLPKFGAVIQ